MAGVLNMEKKYVFIHVPKCAGTSIASVLRGSEHSKGFGDIPGLQEIVRRENRVSAETIGLVAHARARDVQKLIGAETYDCLESFAVVRNPWDRLRSRYYYFRRFPNHRKYKFAKGSLSDFISWACESSPSTMQERLTGRPANVIVKNILKFESIGSDFSALSRKLSLNIDEVPHRNKSDGPRQYPLLPSSVVSMVKRTYEKDFALFDYPDDPPDS